MKVRKDQFFETFKLKALKIIAIRCKSVQKCETEFFEEVSTSSNKLLEFLENFRVLDKFGR